MRKQITVPLEINEIIKRFAQFAQISESAVCSYAITCLCKRFNDCKGNWKKEDSLKKHMKENFYEGYFIKKLPRGRIRLTADEYIKNLNFDLLSDDSISIVQLRRQFLSGKNLEIKEVEDAPQT